jgi:hypothetical protein
MNPKPGERKIIQKLLAALLRAERQRFPDAYETLNAPNEKGVYIIYSPHGKVMHVGSTPRAKRGIAQRLRDHLAGRSSFTAKMFNQNGSQLRNGYQFCCLGVKKRSPPRSLRSTRHRRTLPRTYWARRRSTHSAAVSGPTSLVSTFVGWNIVVEVEYRQRPKDGLRYAALKGIRPEKKPGLIRRSPMNERGPF